MADIRLKALGYLRSGAVMVVHAATTSTAQVPPVAVVAWVRGHQGTYMVELTNGTWYCTCQQGVRGAPCAHSAAVQLVTGHPSPAAKPDTVEWRVA